MSNPTARDQQLMEMPSLNSQMPVVFDNGSQWETLDGLCDGCNSQLSPENVTGVIVPQTPRMVAVEAIGYCPKCNLLTRYVYRLHDDMRITGPMGGQWAAWQTRSNPLQRIVQAVQWLFGR